MYVNVTQHADDHLGRCLILNLDPYYVKVSQQEGSDSLYEVRLMDEDDSSLLNRVMPNAEEDPDETWDRACTIAYERILALWNEERGKIYRERRARTRCTQLQEQRDRLDHLLNELDMGLDEITDIDLTRLDQAMKHLEDAIDKVDLVIDH